jgi:multidrug transporter EmrE-like cation transporter
MQAFTSETRVRLAVAFAAFALAYGLSVLRIGHGAPDFYVFWTAAQHWQTPYDPAIIAQLEASIHLGGVWPFAYPPTFLLFVWPFAQLPLSIAYPLWTGLSAGLFFYAAAHLVRPAWATAVLALTPVVFFSAELGQTSLLIGAATIGAWLMRDNRPVLAGVLLGLAACVKPQAMILAPLVFWGRWRTLGWMLAVCAALAAASLVFGWRRWLEWPHALAAFHGLIVHTDRINPSALTDAPWWVAAVGVFGLYLALTSRDLVGLVGGALCLTPYAHGYDLAPLTPLAASWLFERRTHGWGLAVAGGALLAGLVATPVAALAFFGGVAVMRSRLWPLRGAAPIDAAATAPTP